MYPNSGFGVNLEGFLIKGNLSLTSADITSYSGDGSLEASGSLYIKDIKEYLQDQHVTLQKVEFTNNRIIIPHTIPSTYTSASLFLNGGGLTINNDVDSTSITSGGGLTVIGGASISKYVNIGEGLNMNNNLIENVKWPESLLDATNKEYVDSVADRLSGDFTTGQIIIAQNDGTAIRGYNTLTYNGNNLFIGSTSNINGSTGGGGAIICEGGISIAKDVYIGGALNLDGNKISNVGLPINNSDVATKEYVDDLITSLTFGNINNGGIIGDFTTGQILIADDNNNITGFDTFTYNTTTGTIIISGSSELLISSTENSLGLGTGGSLTVLGGVSIDKDVYIGGTLNLDGDKISNVGLPIDNSDVATKEYVDNLITSLTFGNINNGGVIGDFTYGQILIGDNNNNITGVDTFTYNTTTGTIIISGSSELLISSTENSLGLGTGGSLTVLGGVSIDKDVYIGGTLNLDGDKISNVGLPIDNSDVATKEYVDNLITSLTFGNINNGGVIGDFTYGQILIGDNNNNITGVDTFTYNTTTGTIIISGSSELLISSTENSLGLGTGGSLTVLGGVSIDKDVYIGGTLNLDGDKISNVGLPIDNSDVATKEYVDSLITNLTFGNEIIGNFTSGQILVADANNFVRGFDTFTYNSITDTINISGSSELLISASDNAIGFGSGGSLTVLGGSSINKDLYVNRELFMNYTHIKNVAFPIEEYDAVNKAYVDYIINECACKCDCDSVCQNPCDVLYEYEYTLNPNILIPEDIVTFTFDSDIKAFLSYIYVESITGCSVYTIKGLFKGIESGLQTWFLNCSYIGDNTGVKFYIRGTEDGCIIQYTNTTADYAQIKYRTPDIINTTKPIQVETQLQSTDVFTELTEIKYSNGVVDAVKIVAYIDNPTDNKYGLYFIDCVLKNNYWQMHSSFVGNTTNIKFNLQNLTEFSNSWFQLQYTNTNLSNYNFRAKVVLIRKQDPQLTLSNTTISTNVDNSIFFYDNTKTSFIHDIYVFIPDEQLYTLYEIEGVKCDNSWRTNTRFLGDRTDIMFSVSNDGYLQYTNPYGVDAYIRYQLNTSTTFQPCEPLSVTQGGTGNSQFTQNAVLRGNGFDPIIGTSDFIYNDYTVILGTQSSILIYNTQEAINNTIGGTFTTYGGINVGKNIIVNNVDMTPSIGDIFNEQQFNLLNDQNNPIDISGLALTDINIKSFSGVACITVNFQNDDQYDLLVELKALRKKTGWILGQIEFGDQQEVDINFSITQNGQLQYTSCDFGNNWYNTIMKVRGLVTTI
jgi:hypothetical protein